MSCFSCPVSGARCLEKAWRQLTEGRRKASDSSGLSLHPAGGNVEAEAKLSEAAERKRCPEGRGGRDRPVEVRIQQQAERCQESGHMRVVPLFHRLWQDVCSRSPCEGPLPGHSPARRWHPNSSQRPEEAPASLAPTSMTLLPPSSKLSIPDMESNHPQSRELAAAPQRGEVTCPASVTKLAGSSISP